ncbi:hypothetical protein EON67_02495 [archaeon]|nr:MAG: hypothetical protein EON67_02495 [archaeon]
MSCYFVCCLPSVLSGSLLAVLTFAFMTSHSRGCAGGVKFIIEFKTPRTHHSSPQSDAHHCVGARWCAEKVTAWHDAHGEEGHKARKRKVMAMRRPCRSITLTAAADMLRTPCAAAAVHDGACMKGCG